jgi:hypothetical protein
MSRLFNLRFFLKREGGREGEEKKRLLLVIVLAGVK